MTSILIVDDDEELRTTLARLLEGGGFAVRTAADGFEAAKRFRAEPADVLLADMVMPYGGLPLLRVLREQFPQLRAIAISGGSSHRLGYARDVGALRVLAKPFTPEELMSAIAESINGPAEAK